MKPVAAPPLTPRDFWDITVRRKRLIAGAILATVAAAWLLTVVLPKSYRSSTLILVENQKIPEDYVKGIVGGTIEERLMMIQQQVMSRTLLGRLIEEFGLYQDDIAAKGLEEIVEEMRKTIKVETVGTAGLRGKTVEAFSISFAHEQPMTAMKVTARLASLFIEENLRVREQLVEGASEFLDHELSRAKTRLEEQEREISEFKKRYMGELPEHTEVNLRAHDRLRVDLDQATDAAQSLADRLKLIEQALVDYEQTGATTPSVLEVRGGQVDPLVGRLRELHRELARLQAEYKETYPDIPRVKNEMEQVQAQLDAKRQSEGQDGDVTVTTGTDAYRLGLLRQRDDVKVELNAARERRRRLTDQLAEVESRIQRSPAREQDLMALVRDYENTQKNYQTLLDKKLHAQVAENLEKRQKGEQFRILDPANLPEKPERPNRPRILLLGLLLGCGLGAGLAVMVEQANPVFRRPEEVELLLGLPVLAAIPTFGLLIRGAAASGRVLPAPEDGATPLPKAARGRGGWFGRRRTPSALDGEMNLVARWSPLSAVAEQFRVAATRLALMAAEGRHGVVVVSSAVKGEGKTTVAANLAYTLARDLGKETLVIDGDSKCPALHACMGVAPAPGLHEVLHGVATAESCLRRLGEWPLWVLPAGSREEQPMELAKMHRLGAVLAELRERFDYIIVDAPPILPLADMNVLAGMADLLALVVRAETTSRDVVVRALSGLKPALQTGVILTDVRAAGIGYVYSARPPAPRRLVRAS